MLMIFEDVHWIDPTSLEALSHTVENVRGIPVLLIVTFRPEFNPPWTGQSHVTAVTLNRLHQSEATAIVERIAGDKPLSQALIAEIIERTDGVPLFVEEMTKAILESGETQAAHIVSAVPSPSIGVPASLHASLMARLDRLGPAKQVAQIGAAIGREFSYELLSAAAHRKDSELVDALERRSLKVNGPLNRGRNCRIIECQCLFGVAPARGEVASAKPGQRALVAARKCREWIVPNLSKIQKFLALLTSQFQLGSNEVKVTLASQDHGKLSWPTELFAK
jgi:hypothetical protein